MISSGKYIIERGHIIMDFNDCLFCRTPEERVIYRFKDYFLYVGLGPILSGHILIIPNRHIKSFTNLPPDHRSTFYNIKENIKTAFEKYFGACLMFEHGNHKNGIGLHSHAHLHVIPTKLRDDIRCHIQTYNHSEILGDYKSENSEQLLDQEYLFVDGVSDSIEISPRFYTFQEWPRKYFVRYLVLKATHRSLRELDWEKYPKVNVMKKTIEITKSILDKGGIYGKSKR